MSVDHGARIIVALDFEDRETAVHLVNQLDPRYCRLKVGITLFTKLGSPFVEFLQTKGFDVFLDLKFHDIPAQIYGACKQAANLGCWMMNVHALGGLDMLKQAREAVNSTSNERKSLLIGVTLLTSLSAQDITHLGMRETIDSTVMRLAGLCHQAGLDGVVCSALEASLIKQEYGKEFLTVTPGIRLDEDAKHDQKRVMTPKLAMESGADYLVMGRSIVNSPNPIEVLRQLSHLEIE